MIWILRILGVSLVVGSFCEGDCQADLTELLQRRKHAAKEAKKEAKEAKVALALGGGGFKAQATLAGFFSALLNVKDSDLADVLSQVGAITCSSSGCWYSSQIIYSPSFLTLTELVAKSPNNASHIFKKGWIDPFLAAFDVKPLLNSKLLGPKWAREALNFTDLGEDLMEILIELFWLTSGKESKTWIEFVSVILEGTEHDMKGAKMGSAVNAWAKGRATSPKKSAIFFWETSATAPHGSASIIERGG